MTDDTLLPAETPAAVDPAALVQQRKRKRMMIVVIVLAVILALLLAGLAWYLVNRKPLTQLPVLNQIVPPHASSAIYDVTQPIGIAVDEANNRLYVTESGNKQDAIVFDLEGSRLGELALPGKVIHQPVYVAVDPENADVYVTDRATGKVYVFDAAGNYLSELRPKGTKKWLPLGITVGADGLVYVTDVNEPKQKIWVLQKDGTVVRTMGEKEGLTFPNGLALSSNNSLVVADSNNSRLLVYGPDGTFKGVVPRGEAPTPLGLPRGVAVDDLGKIYAVDATNMNVQVFSTVGDGPTDLPGYLFTFGDEGMADGSFEYPNGIATDTHGRLYITDRANNRVQVWSY